MSYFDKKYVAFGRVIQGMRGLKIMAKYFNNY